MVTAAAMVCPAIENLCKTYRLPDGCSIFTAEAYAIRQVLVTIYIFKDTTPENIVVFSDSLSCLEAIKHYQIKNPFICEILNLLHQLSSEFNKNIHLCWIPSHVDIKGNETAGLAAKSGLNLSPDQITPIKIPHTDLKSLVAKSCTDLWQRYWNEQCSDLKNLHPVLPYRPTYTGLTQHEEWVYTRLHIGHTRRAHGYRLERPVPAQPFCDLCNRELTIEHILINCSSYDEQRAQSFEHCDSLAELFEKTPARIICGFIRDIGLFYDILLVM